MYPSHPPVLPPSYPLHVASTHNMVPPSYSIAPLCDAKRHVSTSLQLDGNLGSDVPPISPPQTPRLIGLGQQFQGTGY